MRTRYLGFLLLLPMLAQAQMYRWVDDSGKVHFSDRPPASGSKNLERRSVRAAQPASAPLPYSLQQATRNFPVTLYVSEACGDMCAQARDLLNKRGVPYREATVADEADLAQLKQLSGGNVVPVLTVGREVHTGFDRGAYKSALDNAGYPASSLLPPGVAAKQPVAAKPAQNAAPAEARPAAPPQDAANSARPK